MRFVRFFQDDEPHLGLRQGDRVFDLTAANEELRGNRLTSVTQLMGHQISQRCADAIDGLCDERRTICP